MILDRLSRTEYTLHNHLSVFVPECQRKNLTVRWSSRDQWTRNRPVSVESLPLVVALLPRDSNQSIYCHQVDKWKCFGARDLHSILNFHCEANGFLKEVSQAQPVTLNVSRLTLFTKISSFVICSVVFSGKVGPASDGTQLLCCLSVKKVNVGSSTDIELLNCPYDCPIWRDVYNGLPQNISDWHEAEKLNWRAIRGTVSVNIG